MNASAYAYNANGFIGFTEPFGLSGCGRALWWRGPGAFLPGTKVLCPSDMVAVGDTCLNDELRVCAIGFDCLSAYSVTDYTLGLTTAEGFPGFDVLASAKWLPRRHAGRWNFVFCDGHTENRRIREMFDPRQVDQVKRWHYDHQPHPELIGRQYPGLH